MTDKRSTRTSVSGALMVADVNDFLTPSANCVLPLGGGVQALPVQEPAGSVLAPIVPTANVTKGANGVQSAKKASVTLSDCLSCSGCVTSAETVLLSTASVDKVLETLAPATQAARDARDKLWVGVGLSQQAVASIAVHLGDDLQSAAEKLAAFFSVHFGADCVFDLTFARDLALHAAADEFLTRYTNGQRPTITSACPGWVTYAEKTQGDTVLEAMSSIKSSQATAGTFVPAVVDADLKRKRQTPWIVTVMSCHDKKLEASRPEFTRPSSLSGVSATDVPEVECVLTASEVLDLADRLSVKLADLPRVPLDARFGRGTVGFGSRTATGSGGYADYVMRHAARNLLGVQLPSGPLPMKKESRSGDVRSITVSSSDGSRSLRFGIAYGFRSLQSVLRKVRRGESDFDYIELMSCPGGCNNGGGQVPSPGDKAEQTRLLQEVEAKYMSAQVEPELSTSSQELSDTYLQALSASVGPEKAQSALRTTHKKRERNIMSELSGW